MPRTFEALEVSKKEAGKRKGNFLRFDDLSYGVRDQLEKLKSSTVLKMSGQETKSILFLSYKQGEGTTTIAAGYAESLAQDRKRKILLVDGNTRNPCLHKVFNINNAVGFSDLFKNDSISEIVMNSDIPNLFIIPGGKTTCNLSQSFDHDRFENIMEDLYKQYDFIIFDSSPIAKYYDSIILASHVNSVVLVVQAEKTPWHEVERAKQMIEDKNIPILGAVLNRRRFYIPGFVFERFF